MVDKISQQSGVYTDVQGLEELRYRAKSDEVGTQKEVSKQFEAILLQMVMKSMRDATKSLSSDMISSDQLTMYEDIFDKQLSLMMSNNGVGFAQMIEQNINDQRNSLKPETHELQPTSFDPSTHVTMANDMANQSAKSISPVNESVITAPQSKSAKTNFQTQEEFVKELMPAAKVAANLIGGDPDILLAQAALETNWGKNIIPHGKEGTSCNLFNIKTGSTWDKSSTAMDTLEHRNGVIVKEKATFRSYDSFQDSFKDYANFLKQHPRYTDAVENAHDPHKFVNALQKAGYATDEQYANKIMQIYKSPTFKELIAKSGTTKDMI